jgi:uncharacterized protein YggT (Ycf19 family)
VTYDPYADQRPERERVTVERVERAPAEPIPPVAPAYRPVVDAPVTVAPSPVDTIRRIVWLLFGVLQALIVLRILLLLLGANEGNELVGFLLGVTDPFVEPFRGMFSLDEINAAGGSVLDLAAVVALIAWTLVEALILGIVGLADRRVTTA